MGQDFLDVTGDGTYVSLTPFHIGKDWTGMGQTNNSNNNVYGSMYGKDSL